MKHFLLQILTAKANFIPERFRPIQSAFNLFKNFQEVQ